MASFPATPLLIDKRTLALTERLLCALPCPGLGTVSPNETKKTYLLPCGEVRRKQL